MERRIKDAAAGGWALATRLPHGAPDQGRDRGRVGARDELVGARDEGPAPCGFAAESVTPSRRYADARAFEALCGCLVATRVGHAVAPVLQRGEELLDLLGAEPTLPSGRPVRLEVAHI